MNMQIILKVSLLVHFDFETYKSGLKYSDVIVWLNLYGC